jgi:sigma54-dependent transcription regulator
MTCQWRMRREGHRLLKKQTAQGHDRLILIILYAQPGFFRAWPVHARIESWAKEMSGLTHRAPDERQIQPWPWDFGTTCRKRPASHTGVSVRFAAEKHLFVSGLSLFLGDWSGPTHLIYSLT